RPGTAVAAYRGAWEEHEEAPVSPPPPPVVVTGNGEGPSGPKSGHTDYPISTPTQSRQQDVLISEALAPVWAVARRRVFWRVTTTSRQIDVAPVSSAPPAATPGQRPDRHGPGRLARRPRGGWWRRRSSAGAQTDAANTPEMSKMSENLGQVQGSSTA